MKWGEMIRVLVEAEKNIKNAMENNFKSYVLEQEETRLIGGQEK